jgi:hypothetical protein
MFIKSPLFMLINWQCTVEMEQITSKGYTNLQPVYIAYEVALHLWSSYHRNLEMTQLVVKQ